MGVPTSEVGYTSTTARRGDHESSYEHVMALGGKKFCLDRVECKYKSKDETLRQSKVLLRSKAEKGSFVSIGKFRGFEKKQLD